MISRIVLAALLIAISVSAPRAQLMMMGIGEGGQGGVPIAACGTGVIDLSTGCTLPIALGLVP